MIRLATLAALTLGSSNLAEDVLPGPFNDTSHIVCTERILAINLLSVFEQDMEAGEQMLIHLAASGACDRVKFSGRPTANLYPAAGQPAGGKREFHVYEVDVVRGDVLKGRTKVYMLLIVIPRSQA